MADQTTETVNQQKQETITKQMNPVRVEHGKRLVDYNHCKKQELKNLNEQITTRYNMIEHKPEEPSNNYLYISGVSVLGLAIIGHQTLFIIDDCSAEGEINISSMPYQNLLLVVDTGIIIYWS